MKVGVRSRLCSMVLGITLGFVTLPAGAEVVRDDNSSLSQESGVPGYIWQQTESSPKAVVVLVHGFTQQAKSFDTLATNLAQDGYLVFAMDQRGHGRWDRSGRKRPVVDYWRSVGDLQQVISRLKQDYPALSIYCIGESAGAGIVAQAAKKADCGINGMVLGSAGTRIRVYNIFWLTRDFLSNIFRLNHPINVRGYISAYASPDADVVREMVNEPLNRNELSGRELLRTGAFIWHNDSALKHGSENIPLLLLQGGKDHIVQRRTVKPLFRHARAAEKDMVVFQNYGHVLMGTRYIHPEVSKTIENWLDSRYRSTLSASAPSSVERPPSN